MSKMRQLLILRLTQKIKTRLILLQRARDLTNYSCMKLSTGITNNLKMSTIGLIGFWLSSFQIRVGWG